MTNLSRRSFFQLLGAAVATVSLPVPRVLSAEFMPGDIEVLTRGVWEFLGRAVSVEFRSTYDRVEIRSAARDADLLLIKGMRDESGTIVFEAGAMGRFNSKLAASLFYADGRVRLRAHVGDETPLEVSAMLMALNRHYPTDGIPTANLELAVMQEL